MEKSIERTIQSLKKNNFLPLYFEEEKLATEYLLSKIKESDTVGIGGSMTITQLNIPELLEERGNKVYFHWLESKAEMVDEARLLANRADVYLSSSNALTEKGQLVNIDGIGNRVCSMIFGPKKAFIVCGINKIVKDLEEAISRIKNNAYKNARRLKLNTPCAITGKCNDCDSPQRMCNVTTIMEKKPNKIDIEVIIINKELGY